MHQGSEIHVVHSTNIILVPIYHYHHLPSRIPILGHASVKRLLASRTRVDFLQGLLKASCIEADSALIDVL